jgi:quinol monooxygenase YgiN
MSCGVPRYELWQNLDQPHLFEIIEEWAFDSSTNVYRATTHIRQYARLVGSAHAPIRGGVSRSSFIGDRFV